MTDEVDFVTLVGTDTPPRIWRCRKVFERRKDKNGDEKVLGCVSLVTNDPSIASGRCRGGFGCGFMFVKCICSGGIGHCYMGQNDPPEDCAYAQFRGI